jgi:peptidoglycan/xylan/chitin deacetylase (PgdA/CDA1 family)
MMGIASMTTAPLMNPRSAARALVWKAGLLGAYHRLRNAATLTVVMFHRILPQPALKRADPEYALSDTLFLACLGFFKRHYTVVSLDAVMAAGDGRHPLPPQALLITFDDGWLDTFSIALPLLEQERLPAVVFAAAQAVTAPTDWWWQEVLLGALRDGTASFDELWRLAPGAAPVPATAPRELSLLLRFNRLEPDARDGLLARFADARFTDKAGSRHMMRPAELRRLMAAGVAVGAHGTSHMPLTLLDDPGADIRASRQLLRAALSDEGDGGEDDIRAMSVPHGRYTPDMVETARQAGLRFVFTSDPHLNSAPGGWPAGRLFGRIDIPAHEIADGNGAFQPARLATWLFTRPHGPPVAPACTSGAGLRRSAVR